MTLIETQGYILILCKILGGGGGKKIKRESKREENYMKKAEKGLKNVSFWVINSKHFCGGGGGEL